MQILNARNKRFGILDFWIYEYLHLHDEILKDRIKAEHEIYLFYIHIVFIVTRQFYSKL